MRDANRNMTAVKEHWSTEILGFGSLGLASQALRMVGQLLYVNLQAASCREDVKEIPQKFQGAILEASISMWYLTTKIIHYQCTYMH